MHSARALVLAVAAVGCREPARPDLPATAPASAPEPVSAPPPEAPMTASAAAPLPSATAEEAPRQQHLAVVAKDDNVVIEIDKDTRHSVVARVRFHRDVIWQHPLPETPAAGAAVIVDVPKKLVYVAHHSVIDNGATLYALDLATGAQRWATKVQGLGPVSHSKYYNHVTLRLEPSLVVVAGDEAQGRYLEAFDPETGKMRWSRPQRPGSPVTPGSPVGGPVTPGSPVGGPVTPGSPVGGP